METHWKPTGLQGVSGKLTMVDHGIGIFLVLGVTSTFATKFPSLIGVGSHAVVNGKKVTAKRGIEVIALQCFVTTRTTCVRRSGS